jgi:hypothetical protein
VTDIELETEIIKITAMVISQMGIIKTESRIIKTRKSDKCRIK